MPLKCFYAESIQCEDAERIQYDVISNRYNNKLQTYKSNET